MSQDIGYVYVILHKDTNLYKIGRTTNQSRRFKELEVGDLTKLIKSYRVFNHKNCNDTLEITIDDPPQNLEIDFIGYTKFTGPGDPLERDDILKHFILLWPNDDMTSYIALSEALFNRAIKLDLDASKDLVSILEMIE